MVIEPKFRGFIGTTAHPEGCFMNVKRQSQFVEAKGKFGHRYPKNVLVIGASTGYGLATRIAAAFGASANTIGVFFEKPASEKRTASPGWYNTVAFEKEAAKKKLYAKSVNGDAFSNEIKQQVAELIEADLGKVDLIVYSLASPRRTDPETGEVYSSVLKPIGEVFRSKTVDPFTNEIKEVCINPASESEIHQTVRVMGGEDWKLWIDFLLQRNLLANKALTVAYSYIGPELTHAIYKNGTIGKAKEHLSQTAKALSDTLASIDGRALISVNKALVTQASAAIPVVPLYISILFKVMKEKGVHEDCIEQMDRLFRDRLYSADPLLLDKQGCIRMDDFEMRPEVQAEVKKAWARLNSLNLNELADTEGYRNDFYQLFGFGVEGVDYAKDVEMDFKIPSISA